MPTPPLPPRWSIEESAPCFIVRDASGQALAFVYCEDEPGRRAAARPIAAWLMSNGIAGVVGRMAVNCRSAKW